MVSRSRTDTFHAPDTRAHRGIRSILPLTLPVMMGYVPLGIIFGYLLVQQGASWWLAPLMSLLLYAGAAQFLAIGLLAAGASIIELTAAAAIVNLRHIFYGLALTDRLPRARWKRAYSIFALTDESFSLLSGLRPGEVRRFAPRICAANHAYWTGATVIGALLGERAALDVPGLEFALTALFTVLAIEQFKRVPRVLFVGIALLAYAVSIVLAPDEPLFVAICLALGLGMIASTFDRADRREAGNRGGMRHG